MLVVVRFTAEVHLAADFATHLLTNVMGDAQVEYYVTLCREALATHPAMKLQNITKLMAKCISDVEVIAGVHASACTLYSYLINFVFTFCFDLMITMCY